MKSIVCIKQVAILAARDGVDAAAGRLHAGSVIRALNPYDEVAVEAALGIRERQGGGTVTVLTLGPAPAEEALRRCVAMGADRAVHLLDETSRDPDPWAVSVVLADVLRDFDYDLILFGKMAIDDEMGQVGTIVAELLDLPVVTDVARIELYPAAGRVRLQRSLSRGNREVVECALPAALTVDRCLNRPRYPTLAGRRRAAGHDVETIDPARRERTRAGDFEPPRLEIVKIAPPKIRPRKILAPDDGASAAGRLQWVLTGGRTQKRSGPLAGDPVRLAEGVMDFLKGRNLLP